jgi:hypothetical protein
MDGLTQDSGPGLNLVKTGLDKLFNQATMEIAVTGKATATDPLVFVQMQANEVAAEQTSIIGGGGYFGQSTDDVPPTKDAPKRAYATRQTQIVNFFENLPISRTFMQDQQLSAVSKAVQQFALAWKATQDRNAFAVYNNGFTTQTTIDNQPLFSNSHLNLNGDTVDNLETGALSTDTLNTTIVSLRGQINQTGVIAGYEPKFLLCSSTLHQTAMATAKSVLRAGTGNNDLNYYSEMYPGMQVLYSPFITSTTAYFVGSFTHGVTRFEREGLSTTLIPWQYQTTDQYIYKMRAREAVDSIDFNGLVGSTGA